MKLLFENWRGYLNEKEQEVREGYMKILFLHGLESKPGGAKAEYLENLGHTVLNPHLPMEDFERSIEIAQAEVDNEQPDIVVGSSRGGAVGMSLDLRGAKLILIAPAWKKFEVPPQTPRGTSVLHCASDEQVAYEDSEKLQGEPRLVPCGEGHRMNDPEALEALKVAVEASGASVDVKEEQNISYSGVVLDEESKQKLLTLDIPEGWAPVAHHMTITMGSLIHKKGKHDFSEAYPAGSEIELPVIAVGKDERAMAVKVRTPSEISKKISFPHVTVAVNRVGGGKPFHSNKIPEENFESLSGVILKGTVEEIPQ